MVSSSRNLSAGLILWNALLLNDGSLSVMTDTFHIDLGCSAGSDGTIGILDERPAFVID